MKIPSKAMMAISLAALLGLAACDDFRVDLGATIDSEQNICANRGMPDAGTSGTVVYGPPNLVPPTTWPLTSVQILGSEITIQAADPGEDPYGLTLRIWATAPGTFRCEDAATAQRTRVSLGGGFSTIYGGSCVIDLISYPGPGVPLQGNFSAMLGEDPRLPPSNGTTYLNGAFYSPDVCWF